jgi:hypothetical protein
MSKHKYCVYPLLAVTWLIFCSPTPGNELKPVWILSHMYDSIKTIRTLQMRTYALERVERRFLTANSEIKVNSHPRKVYYNNPSKKLEILYNGALQHHRALVKPNVFPYIPMYLDPNGSIMRRNQHYTIHELGFEFIGKSIALTISKDKDGLNNFKYLGKYQRNGYNCHMMEYENNSYGYTEYLVRDKETASLIAYRLCVNDYLLRYKNDLLNDFGYLKKGRILKVPTLYCKKALLFIDDHMFLPVSISLYDDTGIFESYDFTEVRKNLTFRPNEFEKDFPGYGF